MNMTSRPDELSDFEENRIYDWFIYGGREQANDAQIGEFEDWLAKKPARQNKAGRLSDIWHAPEFAEALRSFDAPGIADLQASEQPGRAASLFMPASGLAACLVIAAVLLLAYPWLKSDARYEFQTGRSEVAEHQLEDGSLISLNAGSHMYARYQRSERHIDLAEGEARFSVHKDKSRPFVVQTRQATMKALGTVFNVDQRGDVTELTVLEGRVEVTPARQDRRQILTAGERIRVYSDSLGQTTAISSEEGTDWENGRLIANGLPLRELLIEFNRYSSQQWQTSADAGQLLVYGTFDLHDNDKNQSILAALFGLKANTNKNVIYLTQSEGQSGR